jgi:NAD(P)-dependent dehydrogenase (short-subunit alcohol dehydrogenase family)
MGSLTGKTAVVTGGSRGFGRGIVEALAAEGMRVVAVARTEEDLARLKREVNGHVETVAGDVTDAILAARVIEREKPHALILNAGARGLSRPTRLQTWDSFATQLNVDVKNAFLWTREALLLPLAKESAIIFGSSGAALRPVFVNANYAAAKAAIWAFAQGVAGEARQLGIRVHCLLPVMAPETEVGREALEDFVKYMGVTKEQIIDQKGMRPFVTPATVGNAVVSILNDPSKAGTVGFRVTGAELVPIG